MTEMQQHNNNNKWKAKGANTYIEQRCFKDNVGEFSIASALAFR